MSGQILIEIPFLKLLYGPYESNGVIRHKTQRLHGIIQCLSKFGFDIELVPSIHINRLTLELFNREIFRCDIRNLEFNFECEDDVICERITGVVREATKRLYDDGNIPLFGPVSRGKRAINEIKYAKNTQELLSPDIKLWYEQPLLPVCDIDYTVCECESDEQ